MRNSVKFISPVLSLLLLTACRQTPDPTGPQISESEAGILAGQVLDRHGPVKNATVRVQATDKSTTTDDDGRFVLSGIAADNPVTLTACATGYYIGGGSEYLAGDSGIRINLVTHASADNPGYAWLSAYAAHDPQHGCEFCHSESEHDESALPFDQWLEDVHALTAQNLRFRTMYLGTDLYGNQSPPTRSGYSRDYGSFPLPPDPHEPYYGPGYKLDFPATAGNCATCHTPLSAVDAPYGVDPTQVQGVAAEGINCDFCHKIWDVRLNSSTGLPYENMPGVLSYEFRRPPQGLQFFAGPFDDVAPGQDVYSPIYAQSQYCAPCHFGSFWDTVIYNSFGEWLASPYSQQGGRSCQNCHMPAGQTDHFARIDQGGKIRNTAKILSHRMLGIRDAAFLRNAVTFRVSAELREDQVTVVAEIVNDNTGHHIPTGSPLRHLILVIVARDATGNLLSQVSGPVLPDWCGVGDVQDGYYAGMPGTVYAKSLKEEWTGVSPTAAYWNMTKVVRDNRIPAFGRDETEYSFAATSTGEISVDALLIFRPAFVIFNEWKGWDVTDITLAQRRLVLKAKNGNSS